MSPNDIYVNGKYNWQGYSVDLMEYFYGSRALGLVLPFRAFFIVVWPMKQRRIGCVLRPLV